MKSIYNLYEASLLDIEGQLNSSVFEIIWKLIYKNTSDENVRFLEEIINTEFPIEKDIKGKRLYIYPDNIGYPAGYKEFVYIPNDTNWENKSYIQFSYKNNRKRKKLHSIDILTPTHYITISPRCDETTFKKENGVLIIKFEGRTGKNLLECKSFYSGYNIYRVNDDDIKEFLDKIFKYAANKI